MQSTIQRPIEHTETPKHGNLLILREILPGSEHKHRQFLAELKSYPDGIWWHRRRKVPKDRKDVFVVCDLSNPQSGLIKKIPIKRKTGNLIVLKDDRRFDVITGRSLYGEKRYIYPVEDQLVSASWGRQELRQRILQALPKLPLAVGRVYAALVYPDWRLNLNSEEYDRHWGDCLGCRGDLLSEREMQHMMSIIKAAKEAILDHLPEDVRDLRALAEMMENDAKRAV